MAEIKRRSVNTSSLLAQPSLPFSGRHADNAFSAPRQSFTVKPHKSLDEIVSEYFRLVQMQSIGGDHSFVCSNQHAQCEKPIVTCPPFSFYMFVSSSNTRLTRLLFQAAQVPQTEGSFRGAHQHRRAICHATGECSFIRSFISFLGSGLAPRPDAHPVESGRSEHELLALLPDSLRGFGGREADGVQLFGSFLLFCPS